MTARFTVLASGSKGNASLLQTDRFGLLLDVGLGPRQLTSRLAAMGASWQAINAVLLTHTHSDHWNDRTFLDLLGRKIPVYCHADHHPALLESSSVFARLLGDGLVRPYVSGQELQLAHGLGCLPLPLRHDGGATFGFRFQWDGDGETPPCTLGYVADLGCWDRSLAEALADVDVLALEFNHDVALEYASGRQPRLIARVLGDEGHLSNVQAAGLLREVLNLSTPGKLRHVVQLHLSQDCNRPDLAAGAARSVLAELADVPELHTARQDRPLSTLDLGGGRRSSPPNGPDQSSSGWARNAPSLQRWLPGFETDP
jgi:phosphoribosyl 1,2-cyclic phosphodiesterase